MRFATACQVCSPLVAECDIDRITLGAVAGTIIGHGVNIKVASAGADVECGAERRRVFSGDECSVDVKLNLAHSHIILYPCIHCDEFVGRGAEQRPGCGELIWIEGGVLSRVI